MSWRRIPAPNGVNIIPDNEGEIQVLLNKRQRAKETKNFKVADECAKYLQEKDVCYDDSFKTWYIKPVSFPPMKLVNSDLQRARENSKQKERNRRQSKKNKRKRRITLTGSEDGDGLINSEIMETAGDKDDLAPSDNASVRKRKVKSHEAPVA
jgi:hypothetical protein